MVAGVKGSIARRRRADLRNADDAVARRGADRIRRCSPSCAASRRFFLGDLSPAHGGALARRQAGDAGRRDLLAGGVQEDSPMYALLLPSRRQGREGRRARRQVHLRRPGQSRIAAHRRPAHGAAEALVGRHRRARPQARHRRDHAGAAARLRSYRDQGIRRRPLDRAGAGEGLLGREPAVSVGQQQFRRAALRVSSATTSLRWKPSRPTRSTGSRRTAPSNGRRPTTFPRCTTSGWSRKSFRSAVRAACRASSFNLRRDCSRTRGCAGPSTTPSTSRR